MKKTSTVIIAVIALVVGLVLGYAGGTLLGSAGADKVRNAKVQVGDKAPDFRLRDHTGRMIELGDYLGEKNVVLAFLPGAFTPI